MQLRHFKTCHGASDLSLSEGNSFKFQKVTAIAFAPNNSKFAVATVDRYITLYDENGEQKDRFPTKPADKDPASPPAGPAQTAAGGSKNYTVRALEFSSDSTKLAVAQSDKIVFVYKLGLQWGERKTICNKFPQPSPVTTMCWPSERPNEVVFGLSDGQVRVGALRNNKSFGLFQTDSYVISLCPSPEGDAFVSGHLDGSVYRYTFGDPAGNFGPSQALLFHTNFVPYSLAWGEHVCVAGNNPKVQFWDLQGQLVNTIDYSADEKCKEFTCAAMNPSGQTLVLGNYDRFFVYAYDQSRRQWSETASLSIPNLLSVTAVRWRTDGSRLCVGSLCGAVDLFDACLKRYRYKGKFEFTYTSISSAVIKRLSNGAKMSFRSRFNLEIKKINVYSDRYLVASTPETLIVGDLELDKFSEVQWSGSGKERFYFEIASAAMIFNAGELFIVEYGTNEILGSCRTEHMSPHLVSALINSTPKTDSESKAPASTPVKKIAYLLDSATIRVLDLCTNVTEATLTHDSKIDFLELSHRGTKLLFRDKRRSLHLFDIASQTRTTLLEFCNYVQWVPDSDVAVAQNRRNLCIWYSIDNTEQVTTVPIKGDVLQIERAKGRTEVIIDEGISQTAYPLDETLISFGTAVEDKQFERAVSILEELPESASASQGMWLRLSKLATEAGALAIAERCYAAMGDVSKAQCLRKLNRMAADSTGGFNNYLVRAKLAVLNKQFKRAEAIYLEQGQVPLAIEMYRTHHKWDAALSLAQARNHPSLHQLRADYLEYLMSSDQLELAGELKEKEGDHATAIDLYLRGNTPARASQLIISQGLVQDANLLQTVATALLQKGDFERAGEFYEALSYHENALEMYRRARVYRKAVELCRRNFPHYVVRLEEEWGDWLVTQKQSEAAVAHFTECGQYLKAVTAAIEAKQWNKLKILEHLEPEVARPFYKKIAQHYAEIKQFELAEQHYLQGQFYQEAVLMYANAGLWDKGLKIAQSYMSERELRDLCLSQGQALETKGKFAEAEKLYLMTNEPQRAITMYKKNRQYDEMIRLVSLYRKDLLEDTHLHLAKQFQAEGNLKMAEQHYAKTRDWQSCVNMYKAQNMTNEMLRVARAQGGPSAHRLVAYEYALSLGMEGCIKLLEKLGLGEACVELALERSEYAPAQAIAEALCKHRLPDVFLHHALALEDLGQFAEAEAEFLKANKPKEAIDMYNHQQMWSDSMRVAESAMPSAILDVLEAQAKAAVEAQSFSAAEQIYLTSLKRPEAAIRMYIDAKQFPDAVRIAKTHAPHMLGEISTAQQLARKLGPSGPMGVPETILTGTGGLAPSDDSNFLVNQARALESKGQHSQAIDKLIRITADFGSDPNQLEAAWEHAVSLAMEHVPERTNEVVRIASDRLCDLKRFDAAAEIYLGIDAHKEALDVYIKGGLFEKALMIATKRGPQFVQYVRNAQQQFALHQASVAPVAEPAVMPTGAAAIEMYANNGEWDKVYAEAEKQGTEVVQRFASLHAKALVRDNQFVQALHVISQHGVVAVPDNYPLYNRVAKEILGHVVLPSEEKADNADLHLELRQVLFKLVTEMKDIGADVNSRKEFERLLLICHFVNMRKTTAKLGLDASSARLAVSLLRYTNEVPVDQAFFDAGSACRKMKWNNMAFVFFNRFVDINEMLEDPESGDIDNVEFENTDIPQPYDVPAPTKQNFSAAVVEGVRDWVLENAMDANVDQTLSLRQCERCDKKTYEASLVCHNCRATSQPCTVSGYPIPKAAQVQCKSCNCVAIKSEWNQYVSKTKTCPWCGNVANPFY